MCALRKSIGFSMVGYVFEKVIVPLTLRPHTVVYPSMSNRIHSSHWYVYMTFRKLSYRSSRALPCLLWCKSSPYRFRRSFGQL